MPEMCQNTFGEEGRRPISKADGREERGDGKGGVVNSPTQSQG